MRPAVFRCCGWQMIIVSRRVWLMSTPSPTASPGMSWSSRPWSNSSRANAAVVLVSSTVLEPEARALFMAKILSSAKLKSFFSSCGTT